MPPTSRSGSCIESAVLHLALLAVTLLATTAHIADSMQNAQMSGALSAGWPGSDRSAEQQCFNADALAFMSSNTSNNSSCSEQTTGVYLYSVPWTPAARVSGGGNGFSATSLYQQLHQPLPCGLCDQQQQVIQQWPTDYAPATGAGYTSSAYTVPVPAIAMGLH
eukprot:13498-Heterococcus_DN1.PRE.2